MFEKYKDQVSLLLEVLPHVAKEQCFALHGGTAINLFVRDMPRISVDIDLTYLPLEDRETSIKNINLALKRIKENIQNTLNRTSVIHKLDAGKLFIQRHRTEIKLEVNLTNRGAFSDILILPLCTKTQIEYESYLEMQIVPLGQLYGGKICAALDRQHPRDLFDVKFLLENEGFSEEIKKGFLFCLLSSDRPIHEILYPTLQDQRITIEKKFDGMTEQPFTYEDFEVTRYKLLNQIYDTITKADKKFLYDFEAGIPSWKDYDFYKFPGVKWKLIHINDLMSKNPSKHKKLLKEFEDKLNSTG